MNDDDEADREEGEKKDENERADVHHVSSQADFLNNRLD